MNPIRSIFLALIALGLFSSSSYAGEEKDEVLTKQLSGILAEWAKITPGTSRAELLKVFTTEGGISTPRHQVFVHRRCPYIKVEVEFTLAAPDQKLEQPTDTVSKISRPYLESPIND